MQNFKLSARFISFCLFLWILGFSWQSFSDELKTSAEVCKRNIPPLFQGAPLSDQITELPGLGCVNGVQFSGYLPVDPSGIEKVFYWFTESEGDLSHDPIVLWMNGGPGSSSFFGFFVENGPYSIQATGQLREREFSWSKKSSYLIIEQASPVGLSYSRPDSHLESESQAMDQLYFALQKFFTRYPQLRSHPLYLAGQSYAGKYLPELAVRILKGNKLRTNKDQSSIQLKGILVGDGWVNPLVQQAANTDYAYSHGLIDRQTQKKVKQLYKKCAEEISKTTPSSRKANQVCGKMQDLIRKSSGVNALDITTFSEPDYNPIVRYLNDKNVRKALHVDSRIGEFKLFSERVSHDLEIGEQDSAAPFYPELLREGVKILIYNGLNDGTDSNFMGTDRWLEELNWFGKKAFSEAKTCVWKNSLGQVAGYSRSASGLTQIKILGAGHMAPMEQPRNTQEMFHRFILNQEMCH